MRIGAIMMAAGLAVLPEGVAAAQQAGVPAECLDGRRADRCEAERHRSVLRLYRLEPIETYLSAGAQVRRVFYVDGSGRELLALSFIRVPGRDAVMQAHFPERPGGDARPSMEALVPERLWSEVISASALFDRQLVPVPDNGVICLHPWLFTVEAVDPGEGQRPARLRRASEDACRGGLALAFGLYLFRQALPLLPHCMRLDPRHHRNEATIIAECALLKGDRSAAAGAHNGAMALRDARAPSDLALLRDAFGYRATLDWQGQRSERQAAAAVWLAEIASPPYTNFYIETVHGLTADRARVEGLLSRSVPGRNEESDITEVAPVEQIWVRETEHRWTIESVTVGPFRRRS